MSDKLRELEEYKTENEQLKAELLQSDYVKASVFPIEKNIKNKS